MSEIITNQCKGCGVLIDLDPMYDDMQREYCFDCSSCQDRYEKEFD